MKGKSDVFAFRLNRHDANFPQDGEALSIIDAWRAQGYTDRQIMTQALLVLGGKPVAAPSKDKLVAKLLILSERLEKMIGELRSFDMSAAVYIEGENAGKPVDFGVMNTILGGLQQRIVDDEEDD